MTTSKRAFERAMRLAVVSGLRSTFGIALLEAAYDRPNRRHWALAALGEIVVDKIPFVPSRASLPAMLPRAVAGAYVAKQVMDREGLEDPWVAPMGAAVAAGVAVLAPKIRGTLGLLGLPGLLLGLAEDYLALRVGGEALGMTMTDIQTIGSETIDDLKAHFAALMDAGQAKLVDDGESLHSPGAGSM